MTEKEAVMDVAYHGDLLNVTITRRTGDYGKQYGPKLFEVILRREEDADIYFGFVTEVVAGGGANQSVSLAPGTFGSEINFTTHLKYIQARLFDDYGEKKVAVKARRVRA